MGFLGSIGSFLGGAAKVVATGGLSVIAPKLIPKPVNTVIDTITKAQFPTTLKGLTSTALAVATKNPSLIFASGNLQGLQAQTRNPIYSTGGAPMALDIGGILGAVGNLFGGVSAVPAVQGFGGVLSQLAPAFSPQQQMQGFQAMPVANIAVRPRLGSGSISSLTNEIITAGGKLLGTLGIGVSSAGAFSSILRRTLSSMGALARRTPVGTLVSILASLGLTAYEANLLVAWHAQRKKGRRMNPANSKALHRAARRIKRFHKLCTATDVLRGSRRRGSTSRYCGTCRKNPCRC